MKMTAIVLSLFVVSTLAAGCGPGTVCKQAESSAVSVRAKLKDCPDLLNFVPLRTADQTKTCDAGLAACSDADKKAIEAGYRCGDALPACTAATVQEWTVKAQACNPPDGSVSAACLALVR